MRELIYTLLELERGCRETCDFCSNLYGEDNKSVNQIVTRIKASGKYVSDDSVCEECKEKFLNDEIPKCERCGRLQNRHYVDVLSGKNVCYCAKYNEDLEEKELSEVPYESQTTFYERQINGLREQLTTAEITIQEEREAHEDFMEKSEEWGKRQKQELLDEINRLKEKVKQLEEQNKKLIPEELAQKIETYEKEIAELKSQLEKLTSQQQTAQVEFPPKENKIKSFFKFGSK